jgi:hypothetical protein
MVLTILAAAVLGALLVWSTRRVEAALGTWRDEARRERVLQLLAALGPAAVSAREDPKALLAWQPIAAAARRLAPEDAAVLDQAFGGPFPFGPEQIEAAHARWTARWLAWETAHDAEYKLKAASIEQELGGTAAGSVGRARLDAVEREKLARYQQHYEEYTRVSKALRALAGLGRAIP